jgi:AraC family transcriptional regulator, transcriptional activator of pobA
MAKNEQIPVLKNDSYRTSYFKHAPLHNNILSSTAPLQYFEIDRRCTWKNSIQAHRLDFYLMFIVTGGEGIHTFGLKEHYIKKNMLCFVGPNMISSWQSEDDHHQGYFCAFSDDFFNLGRENKNFLPELPFFQIDGNAVLHLTDDQMHYYLSLFEQMHSEYVQKNEYTENVLRSQLHLILYKAYAQYRTEECPVAEANHVGLRLTKAFTAAYMRDFNALNEGKTIRLKKVADYADELGVSQNHLNDTIKAVTGRSAGQLIKNQLIKQATMCLQQSTKSISEIAYVLGYEDPSYFARYYKNQTGQSPSDFR